MNTAAVTPDLSSVSTAKVIHSRLILEGICTHCGHCGQPLTDSVSIERGIGPVCSKKGYHEDPKDGDEVQALIELAEYPELVQFLIEHYKPQGVRGLMNGLVRVCSLNRRADVHRYCCNAIEALGYKNLASTLRKSLASVFVTKSTDYPGSFEVRVLRRDYSDRWKRELTDQAYGVFFSSKNKTLVVPIHKPDDEELLAVNSQNVTNKNTLWNSLVKHYAGLVICTPTGNLEIKAA